MRELRDRLRARHDEGLTLVELLISMAIFSIILALVYTVLITVQRQTVDQNARADAVGNARLALEQIDRQVRSGNVLYSPAAESIPGASASMQCQPGPVIAPATVSYSGTCMRVYTQANGVEKCVQWQVLGTTQVLRSRSWSPTWQTDGQVTGWGVVARNVTNTASTPAFVLQGGTTQYGSRLADVTLKVKNPQAGGAPIDVQSSLSGRNTAYGFDPGVCSPIPPG